MKQVALISLVTLTLTGCLTHAPTDYELDRRAGLTPPVTNPKLKDSELTKFSFEDRNSKGATLPIGYEKHVEKTWVYERAAGGGTLEGTWFWMETASAGCDCDAPYQTVIQNDVTKSASFQNKK